MQILTDCLGKTIFEFLSLVAMTFSKTPEHENNIYK